MNLPTLLVSSKGYDDVGALLQQLGLNTHQLADGDISKLADRAFLSRYQHVFVNCHQIFAVVPSIVAAMSAAVFNFVHNGGAVYVSDWASAVLSGPFGRLVAFSQRDGKSGVTQAMVTDPYLAQRLGRWMTISFDMDGWVRIERFPASADVYLWDASQNPLAVGFRVGAGRVVFTSFHHHKQQTAAEHMLLQWLISVPTQHAQLHAVGQALALHRASDIATRVLSRIGSAAEVIPLQFRSKKGLGVLALSWDYEEDVELSMTYLRHNQALGTEKRSAHPPLVMTIRDPGPEDRVAINRHFANPDRIREDTMQPYVLAVSLRRDLLGDPDWFALMVARHLQASMEGEVPVSAVREFVTPERVCGILEAALTGMGYTAARSSGQDYIGNWAEIRAWPRGVGDEVPDLHVEVRVIQPPKKDSRDENEQSRVESTGSLPVRGELAPGTERVLVCLAFSCTSALEPSNDAGAVEAVDSSSKAHIWRAVVSERMMLGQEQEVVSAKEFGERHYLDIVAYRLEERIETQSANGG